MPWLFTAMACIAAWWLTGAAAAARTWCFCLAAAGLWVVVRGLEITPDVLLVLGALTLLAMGAAIGGAASGNAALMRLVALAWLAAAVISAVVALAQYFGFAHLFAPWMNITQPGEAFANLRQRNQFATLTSIGLFSLLWMARTGRAKPVLLWAGLVLLAVGNAASASRTGAIQLVLAVVVTACWAGAERRRFIQMAGVAIAAYLCATLAFPVLLEALTGRTGGGLFARIGHDVTCDSRIVLWSNVLELISVHPWIGWGWGELDYAHFVHAYSGARFCDILDNAHDLPLQLAVELGVPFALLVCGAGLWAAFRVRPWREVNTERQLAWGVVGVILLHSLLEYPLWYGPFQVATGIAAGLLLPAPAVFAPQRRAVAMAASAVFMVVCGYAMWDYHRVSQIYLPPQARASVYKDVDLLTEVNKSWLFGNQARFAGLTITAPSAANAAQQYSLAGEMAHYSPEPRIAAMLVETAALSGREGEAVTWLQRFRAAFPGDYEVWRRRNHDAAGGVAGEATPTAN